jgi:thiol-disulfide isomerase/thioredoxin
MLGNKRWPLLIMAGMIGSVALCSTGYTERIQKVFPAKEFTLKDLHSKKVRLSDFRGKVIFLNFFATWCSPCRIEIPELAKIYQRNKKKGLVILGISLDTGVIPFMLRTFAKELKIPYPILIGTQEVADNYEILGIPTTLIITREGKTYKRFEGLVPPEYFERALLDLLETKT